MEERHYLISDAAKMVAVEAHVLRYWEEELDLPIARTELGHRYYTRENIEIFKNVKRLKEEGLQLKAIRVLLQETAKLEGDKPQWKLQYDYDHIQIRKDEDETVREAQDDSVEEAEPAAEAVQEKEQPWNNPGQTVTQESETAALIAMRTNAERLQLFKELVEDVVEKVVKDNNDELQKRIEESIAKETDYLLHMQERREEERFRKLDEVIRTHQKNSRYVAAAKEKSRFFRLFGK